MSEITIDQTLRAATERLAAEDADWLADLRRDAIARYESLPLPDRVAHLWRYTDPANLLPGDRTPSEPDQKFGELPADCFDGTFETVAGHVFVRDGRVLRSAIDPRLVNAGVIVEDVRVAAREHADLVRPYLCALTNPAGDKFEALSAALFTGGAFVHVPDKVIAEQPLRVAQRVGGNGLLAGRTVIVVGEQAQATLVFDLTSVDADESPLYHEGIEVFVGAAARVRIVFVQSFGRKVVHAPVVRCRVERDSTLETVTVALGGRLSKSVQTAEIVGRGSNVHVLGIVFADGRQHVDHHTVQDHIVGHNHSDLDYRAIVAGRARSVYTGNLRIGVEAEGADAHQSNHNLLLSDKARADTIPELEILTNDVTCSHAAAVSPIDAEMIFFAQSRGLSEIQARRQIAMGFLEPVILRVPGDDLQTRVRDALDARLEGVV